MYRVSALLLALGCAAAFASAPADGPKGQVAAPPASLGLDPFYARYVDAGGIPVIGSARVPEAALLRAREIVNAMLAARPDIRREMARSGVRVGLIAESEGIMDLPEHRHWKKPAPSDKRLTACEMKTFAAIEKMSDSQYWNSRSRGTGGRFVTAGAENVLAVPGSRYFGENILVHEFSHAILSAMETADPALHGEVKRAYAAAQAAGRWKGDYAAVTLDEYWAEGTQYWFETNMLARLDEGDIVSADDLRRYDLALYRALGEVYPEHRIAADPFHRHLARLDVPEGYKSAEC